MHEPGSTVCKVEPKRQHEFQRTGSFTEGQKPLRNIQQQTEHSLQGAGEKVADSFSRCKRRLGQHCGYTGVAQPRVAHGRWHCPVDLWQGSAELCLPRTTPEIPGEHTGEALESHPTAALGFVLPMGALTVFVSQVQVRVYVNMLESRWLRAVRD